MPSIALLRNRLVSLAAAVLLFLCVLPVPSAAAQDARVVRVGFPLQSGLTMRTDDGTLYGYTYDYLMEISQYTGWQYEFYTPEGTLNEQLAQLLDMLETGKIDVLGGMYYTEALTDIFAYSGYCYGINYSGLFVPVNAALREDTLYKTGHLRVGVYQRALQSSAKLEQFAQMNHLEIEQVVVDTSDEFYALVDNGRADALLSTDLAMAAYDTLTPIVRFAPVPFYFATKKGNTDIVRQIDAALTTIEAVNPTFGVQQYNRYFLRTGDTIQFTAQEQAFAESSGPITVLLYDNKPPFQSVDKVTGKPVGITVEILDQIAATSGLTFTYKTVSTYQAYRDALANGEADIAGDVLSNFQDAQDFQSTLTLPWCSLPVCRVAAQGASVPTGGRVAVPYFLKNAVQPAADQVLLYYDTVQDCLRAVQRGEADFCYAGEFCTQYWFYTSAFPNLLKAHQTAVPQQQICFGVRNRQAIDLLTIFNKCIAALPESTVNDIIYRNTYQQRMSLDAFLRSNLWLIVAVLLVLFLLALFVFYCFRSRRQKYYAFENRRYNAISNLADEHLYEYSALRDTVRVSKRFAAYFSCDDILPHFAARLAQMDPKNLAGIWQLGAAIIHPQHDSCEFACQMPDGSRRWFSLVSTAILDEDGHTCTVGKITDIQAQKAQQQRLEEQAALDGLTGIYNIATAKRLIQEHLQAPSDHAPCAFLILDIDNFKHVNDRFGHYTGDAVLIAAAQLISATFADCLTARLGGDEFIVFTLRVEPQTLVDRCELLCTELPAKTKALLDESVSWSIGITWAKPGQAYEELYREADEALYRVKQKQKNSYAFFEG